MNHSATRPTAWTISLTLHAVIVLAILAGFRGGRRPLTEQLPAHLVYVEPAPPPAAGTLSSTAAVPAAIEPPVAVREPTESPVQPTTEPRHEFEHPPAKPVPHPRHETTRETAPPAPPVQNANAPPADAISSATPGGTLGGSIDGRDGGTVGGLGDMPLPLRDVATPPELVERVLPEYPAHARALRIEGQVMLEVVLDRHGVVEDSIRLMHSIPALDGAAIAAIRQWRFRPARDRAGRPVRVIMEIPVRFILR